MPQVKYVSKLASTAKDYFYSLTYDILPSWMKSGSL